ncbi:IS110 family transposase [Saccharothrix deserti]|uniref:IS110 family transposase n=1 Tax=Saccharothrix deserti TaxID=2593674 RepID=UPI001EE4DBD1|nr:IS110 family transposase [Saccharothrix deserti]
MTVRPVVRVGVEVGKTATEVRWAIDLTSNAGALPMAVLVHTGQQVVHVPGRVVNPMTGVFRGEAKSDATSWRELRTAEARPVRVRSRGGSPRAAVPMGDRVAISAWRVGRRTVFPPDGKRFPSRRMCVSLQ